MVALGFLTSLFFVHRQALKKGIKSDLILNLSFYLLLAGIAGARLIYVITDYSYFAARPLEIFMIQAGGLSVHGAFLGGAIAAYFFTRHHKISFMGIADIIAPTLLIGQAIGRVGCFLAGHCQGKVTDFFIKVKFPMLNGFRHPVHLYEAGLNVIAFALFLTFRNKFKKEGSMFYTIIIVFSLTRLLTDFIREYEKFAFGFSYSQVASVFVVLGFLISTVISARRKIEAA